MCGDRHTHYGSSEVILCQHMLEGTAQIHGTGARTVPTIRLVQTRRGLLLQADLAMESYAISV